MSKKKESFEIFIFKEVFVLVCFFNVLGVLCVAFCACSLSAHPAWLEHLIELNFFVFGFGFLLLTILSGG
jgi:hypothetical protein